jgi:hypothetical protein
LIPVLILSSLMLSPIFVVYQPASNFSTSLQATQWQIPDAMRQRSHFCGDKCYHNWIRICLDRKEMRLLYCWRSKQAFKFNQSIPAPRGFRRWLAIPTSY